MRTRFNDATRRAAWLFVGACMWAHPQACAAQLEIIRGAEFSIDISNWTGAQAALFGPGLRGMLGLWAEAAPRRTAGVEVVYGRAAGDGDASGVSELGVYMAARQLLGDVRASDVFVQARFGVHRIEGTATRKGLRQTGLLLGPEIGLETPIGASTRLIAAFHASWQWYGDVVTDDARVESSGGYAFRYGLRVGVAVRRPR